MLSNAGVDFDSLSGSEAFTHSLRHTGPAGETVVVKLLETRFAAELLAISESNGVSLEFKNHPGAQL